MDGGGGGGAQTLERSSPTEQFASGCTDFLNRVGGMLAGGQGPPPPRLSITIATTLASRSERADTKCGLGVIPGR